MSVLILILALCQKAHGSAESNQRLDELLAVDGIEMQGTELEIRRGIFEASWLATPEDERDDLSLEAMFIIEELEGQKGGRREPGTKTNLELQKREEEFLARAAAPPSTVDNRPLMNKAQNQLQCGNCYLYTFVAALELAYTKATGKQIKFSEQELTDCYFRGCNGGDVRYVTDWMSYIDKLSAKDDYGAYLNGKYTCRSNTTPDSLKDIKVLDAVTVTTENIEAAVYYYGSVMTCMAWGVKNGEYCRMDNYKKGTVVDYPAPAVVTEGCAHAVLIVGYTPEVYIVRNSHGATWGDEGYFFIKRGGNACGIEDIMASIAVESRADVKPLSPNGCPLDKPNLCESINACSASSNCMSAEVEEEELEVEEKLVVEEKRDLANEKRELPRLQKRDERKRAYFIPGQQQEKRSTTSEDLGAEIDIQKRCSDKHQKCSILKKMYGCSHAVTAKYCQRLCNKCGGGEEVIVPTKTEKTGNCYRPNIPNSKVSQMNPPVMKAGQSLVVECESGYKLVGEPVKCLIQDSFTNADKDARLLPECIKLGGEDLVGNGATYSGSRNTYIDLIGREIECDVWNKDVLEGRKMGDKEANKLAIGNHNYCRNPTAENPVPICLSPINEVVTEVYCFQHPGCDTCAGAVDDPAYGADFCIPGRNSGKCEYSDVSTLATQEFYWTVCKATCCAEFC